jgi:hypothetical protein
MFVCVWFENVFSHTVVELASVCASSTTINCRGGVVL